MSVVYPLQNHGSHVDWNQYLISSFKLTPYDYFFSMKISETNTDVYMAEVMPAPEVGLE